jgi:hypothetical protein
MAYFVDSSPSVGITTDIHSTAKNKVGSVRVANDGNTYIYLKGVTSCVDGSVVVFQPGIWTAALAATGLKGGVAIAQAAVTGSSWGWFLYVGQDVITAGSAMTSNTALFIGGVSGNVDDTAVKGDQIFNAFLINAPAATTSAIIQVNRAFVGASNESTG